MFELTVKSEFEAAHHIDGYPGKCARLHGHNWSVEAVARGTKLNDIGILLDFKTLKTELNKILDALDHQYLNELDIFANKNPTAEILAKEVFDRLAASEIFTGTTRLAAVRIYESPKSCVTYTPD